MMHFTTAQVDRFRQWGDNLQDTTAGHISREDAVQLIELYKLLGMLVPASLLEAAFLPTPPT